MPVLKVCGKNADEGMKHLFNKGRPHFVIWLWIYDPTVPSWIRDRLERAECLEPPHGTALHYASFCGVHKVVKVLVIELSEDVNSRSFNNESMPLHLTSQDEHVKIAQFLVEHGTARVAQDIAGMTPLHLTSSSGHLDRARFLVEHGADAAPQNNFGETPLHLASSSSHPGLAWFLVEHGADAVPQNSSGETPLHLSSSSRLLDLAQFFVEHGADTDAEDNVGETPLHLASSGGHLDLAWFLVEHGADVAARNKDGSTPLHESGHLLAWLLADAAPPNSFGETPLHLASSNGHLDLGSIGTSIIYEI
jgi:ankyrin repeat protein